MRQKPLTKIQYISIFLFTIINMFYLINYNAFAEPALSPKQLATLKQQANMGDVSSQETLGNLYQFWSSQGVRQNSLEAAKWYKKAAQQGSSEALNNLGNMYHDGNGVPQNYNKSIILLKEADHLGNPSAAFNIALIYYQANNPSEAIGWFQKAARQGNGDALNNLGIIYGYGQGVPQDTSKATTYFKQACKHNNVKGCRNYQRVQ